MRSSIFDTIIVVIDDLKEYKVSNQQALQLSMLLGIVIVD